MTRSQKIDLIAAVILIGFMVAVGYHYWLGVYWRRFYPDNTFLFLPSDRFADFYTFYFANLHRNPYLGPVLGVQYPLLNAIGYLFTVLNVHDAYFVYSLLVTTAFVYLNATHLGNSDIYASFLRVVVFTFFTYPALLLADRGNPEALVFIALAFFLYFWRQGKWIISSVCLASAIAMKLAPILFLVFLVAERRFKEIAYTLGFTLLLTGISLCVFEGGFLANADFILRGNNIGSSPALTKLLSDASFFQRGVTLFGVTKLLLFLTHSLNHFDANTLLILYKWIGGFCFLVLSIYIIFIEQEQWKRLALTVFAFLMFPHLSADYKLIHIFLPMYLLINTEQHQRTHIFYALMFALLLIPKDYYLFPGISSDAQVADISIAMLINPTIMLITMAVIVIAGLRTRFRQAATSGSA